MIFRFSNDGYLRIFESDQTGQFKNAPLWTEFGAAIWRESCQTRSCGSEAGVVQDLEISDDE